MSDSQFPTIKPRSYMNKILFIVIAIVVLGIGGYFSYLRFNTTNTNTPSNTSVTNTSPKKVPAIPVAQASAFAVYTQTPVTVQPSVTAYSVQSDLSNVTNTENFSLSDSEKTLLSKNAFVVTQGYDSEFYPLYEQNRYRYVPSFVTTDSILHNYHLIFDHVLRKLEEDSLNTKLKTLTAAMLSQSEQQLSAMKGTSWENAARTNVVFFSVASKLIDSHTQIPLEVNDVVNKELELISAHSEVTDSPLTGEKEDYSQYVPRGHYDKTETLKSYFITMMWYGRMTFLFKKEDQVKSSALMTIALDSEKIFPDWDAIYEVTSFFVGKSDDVTYYQLRDLLKEAYGTSPSITDLKDNTQAFELFLTGAKDFAPPQINSIPIFESSVTPDRETETKGFRFMGQRFTIDASIFQRLVCRDVGNKHGTEDCGGSIPDSRMLPKSLDIPAALGSSEAEKILTATGEKEYFGYAENLGILQQYLGGLDTNIWTQNLYWGWMYNLLPFTKVKGTGFPIFMQNTAWQRKELNTFLGSWTELKHDTILYAKQVYAELGGGPPEERDDRGYVEPNPLVYARLTALLTMTKEGLEIRGLLSDATKDNLSKMATLSDALRSISEKELQNQTLSDDEYELIRSYGGQLEHFWLEVNKEEIASSGVDQLNYLDQNPAAIVADVATDPNGSVLEEGTGKINEIYVVVPIDGKLRIAKGGVYSYYEFPWPLSNRLTDTTWRELLQSDQKPVLPEWTAEFVSSEK